MTENFFVFPEEEESPEVRAAKLRIQRTLKRNRQREKDILQPLPTLEKILLNENISQQKESEFILKFKEENINNGILKNEKKSLEGDDNNLNSLNKGRRKKKRKMENKITENNFFVSTNYSNIALEEKKDINKKNENINKTEEEITHIYQPSTDLINVLSKHLDVSLGNSENKINFEKDKENRIIEEKENSNIYNSNIYNSNIYNSKLDNKNKVEKKDKTVQKEMHIQQMNIKNESQNINNICDAPKENYNINNTEGKETHADSILKFAKKDKTNERYKQKQENKTNEENKQRKEWKEEKIEKMEKKEKKEKKEKEEEEIVEDQIRLKNIDTLNQDNYMEIKKTPEENDKKTTSIDADHQSSIINKPNTINTKTFAPIKEHISNDKQKENNNKQNEYNEIDKITNKNTSQEHISDIAKNTITQNIKKKRNSLSAISIRDDNRESPITISSISSSSSSSFSSSDSSAINYLELKGEKRDKKIKGIRENDTTLMNGSNRNHVENEEEHNARKRTQLDISQLQSLIEKRKVLKKKNPEEERKKLMKNLKIHYNNLNNKEKLYYSYMMNKLSINYDKRNQVFYNEGMFITHFFNSVMYDHKYVNNLGYLEYSIYYILKWLTPTREEKLIKLKALMKLEVIVKSIFPKCKMEVFGSFVTGLSIPGGDVDVCFMNIEESESDALHIIAYALVKLKICHSFNILIHAKVKILRYIDRELGVFFDVCINQKSSRRTTDFIAKQVKKFIFLRPLVLLVKFFLSTRQLNETYLGGIGSFLLSCMVLHFLQMHKSSYDKDSLHNSTLATLLLEFFHFYNFDYKLKANCAVLRGMGHIIPLQYREDLQENEERLCFENPIDTELNVGQKSFRIKFILYVFSQGYCNLISLLYKLKLNLCNINNFSTNETLGNYKKRKNECMNTINNDIIAAKKEEENNSKEEELEKGKKCRGYIIGNTLNPVGLYPLFYGHFLNPHHIIFTKRMKTADTHMKWNADQCSYFYSVEDRNSMFKMLYSDLDKILASENDKSNNDNCNLFDDFTKIFAVTLEVKNNIFKEAN